MPESLNRFKEVIDSKDKVNIISEDSKFTSSGNLYVGGAFMGNEKNNEFLSDKIINTDVFISRYTNAANFYAKWNQDNKYGNSNYRKLTTIKPYSFIEITKTK